MRSARSSSKPLDPPWPPSLAALLALTERQSATRIAREARLAPHLEGLRPLPFAVVKIAGTNGKGSVCAMLEAVLRHAGASTGTFTSPHLFCVAERFRLDGQTADLDRLELLAAAWWERLAGLPAEQLPTFFEILMLVALDLFKRHGVAFAIFEAGIGGRDDGTRVLEEQLAAITSVGLDHAAQLGASLASVAAHKSAICRAGGQLVVGLGVGPEATAVIARDCAERGIALHRARPCHAFRVLDHGWASEVQLEADQAPVRLNLAGPYQRDNLLTVQALCQNLIAQGLLADGRAIAGVAAAHWPGRLQRLPGAPEWILDVAHNPEGLTALAAALRELHVPFEDRLLVYGGAAEKDLEARIPLLAELAPRVVLTGGFHRAASLDELARHLPVGLEVVARCERPELAYDQLCEQAPSRRIIVTGSVFLVGAMLALRGAL